jgi:2-oxoglutarate dehydrogenase E2 component (dihydrolipoamide succinyltransferase)
MAIVDLIMPKLGESIMEATILKWHKRPGDSVKMDETVLEIATDKVDSEVPSTAAGVMEEILFKENDVVPIGTVIARIKTGTPESVAAKPTSVTPTKDNVFEQPAEKAVVVETIQRSSSSQGSNGSTNRFYSPLVLNIAASEGISLSELENIAGTGNDGRVTKKDILQYVSQRKQGQSHSPRSRGVDQEEVSVYKQISQPSEQSSQITTYSGNVNHRNGSDA